MAPPSSLEGRASCGAAPVACPAACDHGSGGMWHVSTATDVPPTLQNDLDEALYQPDRDVALGGTSLLECGVRYTDAVNGYEEHAVPVPWDVTGWAEQTEQVVDSVDGLPCCTGVGRFVVGDAVRLVVAASSAGRRTASHGLIGPFGSPRARSPETEDSSRWQAPAASQRCGATAPVMSRSAELGVDRGARPVPGAAIPV